MPNAPASAEPRYPFVVLDVEPDRADELSAELFALGAEGVEERDQGTLVRGADATKVTLVAAFGDHAEAEAAIAALVALDDALAPRLDEVVGDAWRDAWKEHYKPFALAPGIVVRPPWEPYDAKDGERVLELEPGRAFGTGLHATTSLVADALVAHAEELRGARVLDAGCGSGILALVALELGATHAVCVDVDPDAVEVTHENAARNGRTADVSASTTALDALGEAFPVVVANIEAKVLVPEAASIAGAVAPGGLLLLSGILLPQKEDVRAAYPAFDLIASPDRGEWTLLALRRR